MRELVRDAIFKLVDVLVLAMWVGAVSTALIIQPMKGTLKELGQPPSMEQIFEAMIDHSNYLNSLDPNTCNC